ncbi:MAG: hypothetical protein WC534_01925 [Candidatus Paceibacterota bacterium]
MKKDINAAQREQANAQGVFLDTKIENVKNQLEKEKAVIAALAQKEKELEQKQALEEKPLNSTEKNIPIIEGNAIIVPMEKRNQIKINVAEGDSEEEKELMPHIEEAPTNIESVFEKNEPEPELPIPAFIAPKKDSSEQEIKKTIKEPELTEEVAPKQIKEPELTEEVAQEENISDLAEEGLSLAENLTDFEQESPDFSKEDSGAGLAIDDLENLELPESDHEQIDIGEIPGLELDDNLKEEQGLRSVDFPFKDSLEKKDEKEETIISLEELKPEKKKEDVLEKEETAKEESFLSDEFFSLKKEETNEEKLRKLTDLIFEIEQNIIQINDEKIPFEEKRKDIEREIDKARQRLDLILERKKRIEELKKTTETKEEGAETAEEKRNMEKERWKIEDERNTVEQEKNKKEDEIKSLRLQLNEFNLNFEKILSREKELNMELDLLKRDKNYLILNEEKEKLLEKLEKVQNEANSIKDLMNENTSQKELIDKKINKIKEEEQGIEEEIKVLEKRTDLTIPEIELRKLEAQRKSAEEKRRKTEEERWQTEDDLSKAESLRLELREKYQSFASEANELKEKISEINKKMNKND